ncbi:MAG: hypothetical protein A2Z14_11160 [Chloroflexi bacterium RBG_16_48_8]|nr:MAG: hypothetical protein A2Z14_11160 [Chloroflexi bacterium RBG_16_48_8]
MGNCYIFPGDDARVQRFIDKLEEREKYLEELEVKRNELWPKITDTIATCLQSIGGGLGIGATIVGIIAAVEPTQIVKTLAIGGAIVSVVGCVAICGSSVASTYSEGSEQQIIIENITDTTNAAIFEFLDLRDKPPE